MFPNLLLVYGPGSGLGKSTVCRNLMERMNTHGHVAKMIEEEEVPIHPAFQTYVNRVKEGLGNDTVALLDCCSQFIAELSDEHSQFVILDSILPCWDWLYSAGCSNMEVSTFSRNLAAMLVPFSPVLVYVRGNLDATLKRAIVDRGQAWATHFAERRTGRPDLDSLSSYFKRLQAGAEKMLPLWPYRVIHINTVTNDLATCVDQVVTALSAVEGRVT